MRLPTVMFLSLVLVLAGCGVSAPPAPVSVPDLPPGSVSHTQEPAAPPEPAGKQEPPPGPTLVAVEWAAGDSRGSLEPGRPVNLKAPDTAVRLVFSAPVAPESLQVEGSHPALTVTPDPGRSAPTMVALRVSAAISMAGELRITALTDPAGRPVPDLPLLIPVMAPTTPPMTDAYRAELVQEGLRLWALASAGNVEGLKALIAPEEQLSSPGGEFLADDAGVGLEAVVKWAQARQTATPTVVVQGRRGHAMYDVIIVDTGSDSGHFVAFVTIPERKVAKLFGLKNYFSW